MRNLLALQLILFFVAVLVAIAMYFLVFGGNVAFAPQPRFVQVSSLDELPSGEIALDILSVPAEELELSADTPQNRILIERIGVSAPIWEGGEEQLAKGVWRLPGSGTPESGSMVVSSHRWKYLPPDPRTFFNLDSLEPGDAVQVLWKDVVYTYIVDRLIEIDPTDTKALHEAENGSLILFTCTPLYSTEKRLVIVAMLHKE